MNQLKYTRAQILLIDTVETEVCNFTKSNIPPWFSGFLNCSNGTKSRKASQMFFLSVCMCSCLCMFGTFKTLAFLNLGPKLSASERVFTWPRTGNEQLFNW